MRTGIISIISILVMMSLIPVTQGSETVSEGSGSQIMSTQPDGMTEIANGGSVSSFSYPGFVENRGQIDDRIEIYRPHGDIWVGFSSDSIFYSVSDGVSSYAYNVDIIGSRDVKPAGKKLMDHRTSFFIGDGENWASDVNSYSEMIYQNIYHNIDILFRIGENGSLKYDIMVHPGGDPADVKLGYNGVDPYIQDGKLIIPTPAGDVIEDAPVTYQSDGKSVFSEYILEGNNLGFGIGEFDTTTDLIIDPGVRFSTYLGGSMEDEILDVAVDDDGYLYATGSTTSSGFPTVPGSYDTTYSSGKDVFVAKFNGSGERLIYSTFIGSSSDDIGYGIDIDSNGNAHVVGSASTGSYPTINGFRSTFGGRTDGFITKLNSSGTGIIHSSLIGGWGSDIAFDVIVDGNGNPIITGQSGFFQSGWWQDQFKFPTTSGAYDTTFNGNWNSFDGFLMKVASDGGSMDFSTLIGGGGNDYGYAVTFDQDGDYYITGETGSNNFPTTSGAYDTSRNSVDAFISKFNEYGSSLISSTFVGGSGQDRGRGIVVDASERPYITGETSSSNFPTTTGAYDTGFNGNYDGFIIGLDADMENMYVSTFIGGSGSDNSNDIIIDESGRIRVGGNTASNNFPVSSDALMDSRVGSQDGFAAILNSTLSSLVYSTYLGGSGSDSINGVDIDQHGMFNVGGVTSSSDLPVSGNGLDGSYNGNSDGFAARFYPADFSPVNLVSQSGYFHVKLDWNMPAPHFFEEFDILGYRIYRGLSESELKPIAMIGNETEYNDTINYFVSRDYTYRVCTVFDAIGESVFSNSATGKPMVTPRPLDPAASAGDMFVNLTWEPIDQQYFSMFDITYNVYRGLTGNDLSLYDEADTENSFNDTGIVARPRTYHYAVSYSLKEIGESNRTKVVMARPNTPPGPPCNLTAEDGDMKSVLQWSEPEDNGGYTVSEYSVYMGLASGELERIATVDLPSYTVEDLDPGIEYTFEVRAENRIGHSFGSKRLQITGRTVPSHPKDIIARERNGEVRISWREPAFKWGLPLTSYTLYVTTGEETEEIPLQPGVRSHVIDVTNGEIGYFSVTASNIIGEGNRSAIIQAAGRGIPGEVVGLTSVSGDSSGSLFWTGTATDGGEPVRSFKVYMGEDPETRSEIAVLPPNTTDHHVDGLQNGRTYYLYVSAVNDNGEGPVSDPVRLDPGCVPARPEPVELDPNYESITLDWLEPRNTGGRDGTDIRIYRGSSKDTLQHIATIGFDTTTFTDDGLDPRRTYHYSLSAVNVFGEGPLSDSVSATPFGKADAPMIISYAGGPSWIDIEWSTPTYDGGSPVIGYLVEYRAKGGSDWDSIEVVENSTRISSLAQDTKYQVKVSAVTEIIRGKASPVIEQLVGDLPEPPISISAAPEGNDIKIKWTPRPLSTGRVDQYRIYLAVNGGKMDLVDEVDGSARGITVPEMVVGNRYSISISSVNGVGEGPRSENRTFLMKGVPDVPGDIFVIHQGPDRIEIQWEPPARNGAAVITGYDVYRGTGTGSLRKITQTSDTRFNDDGIEAGRNYSYYVIPRNSVGQGERSETVSASSFTVPDQVNGLRAVIHSDKVVLKWNPPAFDGGSDIAGYLIYRSRNGGDRVLINRLDAGSVGMTDDSVVSGSYRYTVVAINSIGEGQEDYTDADVPSRIPWSVLAFLLPMILIVIVSLMMVMIPSYIKRRKEKKEIEEKERREKEKEMEKERARELRPSVSQSLPGSAPTSLSSKSSGGDRQLPPAEKKIDEASSGEGYIRPSEMKKRKKDKKRILRADGRSLEERESEKHISELPRNGNGIHPRYKKEMEEVLKKESESVFTGEQPMAPPPVSEDQGSVEGEVIPTPGSDEGMDPPDETENVREWPEDEMDVPLSKPPEQTNEMKEPEKE